MCENSFSQVAAILIRGHPYVSLPIGNDNDSTVSTFVKVYIKTANAYRVGCSMMVMVLMLMVAATKQRQYPVKHTIKETWTVLSHPHSKLSHR